jgi:MtN3 and saliva related transmembrane protein
MSDLTTVIGGIAALLSTVSFLPQAIKIIRTRDTESISTGMYAVTVVGFVLWTAYGVLLPQWPVIASNGICLMVSGFILAMKILPHRDRDKVAETLAPIVGAEAPTGQRREEREVSRDVRTT